MIALTLFKCTVALEKGREHTTQQKDIQLTAGTLRFMPESERDSGGRV